MGIGTRVILSVEVLFIVIAVACPHPASASDPTQMERADLLFREGKFIEAASEYKPILRDQQDDVMLCFV